MLTWVSTCPTFSQKISGWHKYGQETTGTVENIEQPTAIKTHDNNRLDPRNTLKFNHCHGQHVSSKSTEEGPAMDVQKAADFAAQEVVEHSECFQAHQRYSERWHLQCFFFGEGSCIWKAKCAWLSSLIFFPKWLWLWLYRGRWSQQIAGLLLGGGVIQGVSGVAEKSWMSRAEWRVSKEQI